MLSIIISFICLIIVIFALWSGNYGINFAKKSDDYYWMVAPLEITMIGIGVIFSIIGIISLIVSGYLLLPEMPCG